MSDILSSLFGFNLEDSYNNRKLFNTTVKDVIIDTCRSLGDTDDPYETGIQSKHYNNGEWVIVEEYEDEGSAIEGHNKLVDIFKDKYPEVLSDVSTAFVAKICDRDNMVYEYKE
jgi:hypothetical protein